MPLPRSRLLRIILGALLMVCGVLGFLPVIGFWMFPLGLLVLSVDLPIVRRWRRKLEVRFGKWRRERGRKRETRNQEGSTGRRKSESAES